MPSFSATPAESYLLTTPCRLKSLHLPNHNRYPSRAMLTLLLSLLDCFRARAFLQAEILALRHQLLVLQRSNRGHKLRLGWADRVLWVWLSRLCLAVVERLAIGVAPCQTGDGYRL